MGEKKKEGESVREERKSRKKCMDLVSEEERERGVNLSCFTGRGWLQRGEGKKKKKTWGENKSFVFIMHGR